MARRRCFVLVHSPLVGPSTWRWVGEALVARGHEVVIPSLVGFEADGPPYWPSCVDAVVRACGATSGHIALVGHSGAGPLLPRVVHTLDGRAGHVVFAEAALAPLGGDAPLAPGWLRDHLRTLAVDGRLPKWSQWWGEGVLESAVPDAERRRAIDAQLPRLPLDYFDQVVPEPDGWADGVACSYLWHSEVYRSDAEEAARRGWPVLHVPGGHLHLAVEPEQVADALLLLTSGDLG